jgi:hypothetical protein
VNIYKEYIHHSSNGARKKLLMSKKLIDLNDIILMKHAKFCKETIELLNRRVVDVLDNTQMNRYMLYRREFEAWHLLLSEKKEK